MPFVGKFEKSSRKLDFFKLRQLFWNFPTNGIPMESYDFFHNILSLSFFDFPRFSQTNRDFHFLAKKFDLRQSFSNFPTNGIPMESWHFSRNLFSLSLFDFPWFSWKILIFLFRHLTVTKTVTLTLTLYTNLNYFSIAPNNQRHQRSLRKLTSITKTKQTSTFKTKIINNTRHH